MAKKSSSKSRAKAAPEPSAAMRIVVLHGSDTLRIRDWTRRLTAALEEVHGEIQRFEFDGETTEPAIVLDELRSYGLLQEHKLVVLTKADQFLAVKDEEDSTPKPRGAPRRRTARQLMEAYAEAPAEDATLILRADSWRASKIDKLVAKVGAVIKFEPPNEAESTGWITREGAKRHKVKVASDAAALLVERLGVSLDRLDTELAKLASFVGEGGAISRDLVVEMVGMSREEEAWLIQQAVAEGDPAAAFRKLQELLQVSQHSDVPLMWSVIDLVRKLYAVSKLLRQGHDEWNAAKAVGVWGDSRSLICRAARQLEPRDLAQLLRDVVRSDFKAKTGQTTSRRSLEVQTLLVADTIGQS